MNNNILTVNELFSGIGAQERALKRCGINYKILHTCEVDKDAVLSYAAMRYDLIKEQENFFFPTKEKMVEELQFKNIGYDFQKNKHTINMRMSEDKVRLYYLADSITHNYGDISKIEKLDYSDFLTYSFPCTDISVAGKQAGINEGTRSGLLYQVQRLLSVAKDEDTLPKYLMLENVKNLVGKKFKEQFDEWVSWLDELGYNTYWQVLNAKNYGIPQNRERVFGISIIKDIDNGNFEFPQGFDNVVRLKDLLESEVDEGFYISEDKVSRFITDLNSKNALLYDSCQVKREGKSREYNDYSPTLSARDYKDPKLVGENKIVKIGNIEGKNFNENKVVYNKDYIAPTIQGQGHCGNEPKILETNKPKELGFYSYPDSNKKHQSNIIHDKNYISPTLDTMQGGNRQPKILETQDIPIKFRNTKKLIGKEPVGIEIRTDELRMFQDNKMGTLRTITECGNKGVLEADFRIRKLTPKECFRLMGFNDEDFDKTKNIGVSNSQLYKQAGNSIVVDVLYYIFCNLFKEYINKEVEENFTQPQGE